MASGKGIEPLEGDPSRTAALRSALECPCCSEILQSPLIFRTCGHCFCSTCIRRWLLTKRSCPQCNAQQDEQDLIPCFAIGRIVDAFLGKETHVVATEGSTNAETAQKLPQVVYHVLADDKLDEGLRSFGLPTNGNREMKILLHREYTLAYNSQLDAGASQVDLAQARKAALAARSSKLSSAFFHAKQKPSSSSSSSSAAKSDAPVTLATQDIRLRRYRKRLRLQEQAKFGGIRVSTGWRAVFSDYLNKPVYYNSVTKECTTERPLQLELDAETEASTRQAEPHADPVDDDDVIVVIEKDG